MMNYFTFLHVFIIITSLPFHFFFIFSFPEEVKTIFSTDAKSPTLTSFDKPLKCSNETKKESVADTDDSFDIFLPLKVKNYKNGLKKPNTASSTNKFKKKKVTSSNRICPYFSTRRSPTSSKEVIIYSGHAYKLFFIFLNYYKYKIVYDFQFISL